MRFPKILFAILCLALAPALSRADVAPPPLDLGPAPAALAEKPPVPESSRIFDWYTRKDAPYQVLQTASAQARAEGWGADLLKAGQPIPQATARDLAWSLAEDPRLEAETRKQLLEAFSSEPEQYMKAQKDMGAATEEMRKKMEEVEKAMEEVNARLNKNNYTTFSQPKMEWQVKSGFTSDYMGAVGTTPALESNFNKFETGSINFKGLISNILSYNIGVGGLFYGNTQSQWQYIRYISIETMQLSLPPSLDFSILKVRPTTSAFLNYSASPSTPNFYNTYDQGDFRDPSRLYDVTGDTGLDYPGIMAHQQGGGKWWPFNESTATLEMNNVYNAFFTRLDMRGFDAFGLLDETLAGIMFRVASTDRSQLFSQSLSTYGFTNASYGFAFNAVLPWTLSLKSEFAWSNWVSEYATGLQWRDSAATLNLTKAFPRLTLNMTLSQVGPYFITNDHYYNSGNFQGVYSNTPTQRGKTWDTSVDRKAGDPSEGVAWQTINIDPKGLNNNTRLAYIMLDFRNFWANAQLSAGAAQQINPSNNTVLGDEYLFSGSPYMDFNNLVSYYYKLNLTEKGVGDPTPRTRDSIKTFNNAGAFIELDGKSLLDLATPLTFQIYGNIFDTAEDLHPARISGEDIFCQTYSEARLIWGVNYLVQVQPLVGYETALSYAGMQPLNMIERYWGMDVKIKLFPWLRGAETNLSFRRKYWDDLENDNNSWMGWHAYAYIYMGI